jgi:hypothetical protein
MVVSRRGQLMPLQATTPDMVRRIGRRIRLTGVASRYIRAGSPERQARLTFRQQRGLRGKAGHPESLCGGAYLYFASPFFSCTPAGRVP